MTKEEILAMEAGRELDELIAIKVMGVPDEIIVTDTKLYPHVSPYTHNKEGFIVGWNPSTDISAAWEVLQNIPNYQVQKKKCGKLTIRWHITRTNRWNVVESESAPEAICKAALLALIDS